MDASRPTPKINFYPEVITAWILDVRDACVIISIVENSVWARAGYHVISDGRIYNWHHVGSLTYSYASPIIRGVPAVIRIIGLILDFSICLQKAFGVDIAIEVFLNRCRSRICDGGRFQKACVLLRTISIVVIVSRHDGVLRPVQRLKQVYAIPVMKIIISAKRIER